MISPIDIVHEYGVDQMRYFFMRDTPFGADGSYSNESIALRINADLANDLGNLAQRCLSMIAKNCGGKIPEWCAAAPEDKSLLEAIYALRDKSRDAMESFEIHLYLAEIWRVIGDTNRYFAAQSPWTLSKSNPERRDMILGITAESLRNIAILLQPVMPAAMGRLLDLLGQEGGQRSFAQATPGCAIAAGVLLPPPSAIFPRYEAIKSTKQN